jgi:hypothetical protein
LSSIEHIDRFRVLVINEPRYYREVVYNAVRILRPNIEVTTAESSDLLDQDLARLAPDLVICSQATPTIRDRCFAWVELYPDGESLAVVCIGKQGWTLGGIELNGLLSIIDRAKEARNAEVCSTHNA